MGRDRMAKKEEKNDTKRRRRQQSTAADWGGVRVELLRQVVAAVTATGGAVRFGYTRDGGAYSVGIYGDGKPYTEFCPGDANVEEWLEGIAYDFE